MTVIYIWIGVILLIVAFVIFLAIDDRNNRRIRAEEDRLKAQEEQKEAEQKEAEQETAGPQEVEQRPD